VQGNYVGTWEDLTQSENRKDMLNDLRAYREAEPDYPHRIIRRRELKED
jgi:hypothetical protein